MDFLTLKERIQGDVEGGQVGEHLHDGVVGVELGGRGAVQVSRSDAVVPDAVVPDAVISGAVNSDAARWLVTGSLRSGLSGAGLVWRRGGVLAGLLLPRVARHLLLVVVIRNMMGTSGELSMKFKCGVT